MAKTAKPKLTAVKKRSGEVKTFKKFIGGRYFFLGPERDKAEKLALALLAKWAEKKATEADPAWTEAEISAAASMREQAYGRSEFDSLDDGALSIDAQKPQNAPESPKAWEGVTDYDWTIGDALAAWKKTISESGKSPQARKNIQSRMDNLGKPFDRLLAERMEKLDFDAIQAIIEHQIRQAKESTQSPQTAKNKLNALRLFVEYCHRSERIDWRAFEDWRLYFTNSIKRLGKMLRTSRKRRKRQNKLSTKTLKKLYKAASERTKLFMLLALNTGQLNSEIATLTLGMLKLDSKTPTIERERSKTGVDAKWTLWPETLEMLRQAVKHAKEEGRTKADDLLFLSQKGKPLVWYDDKDGRIDSIGQCWQRIKKRCDLSGKGYAFSYLRKLSSQWIRDNHGRDYAEAFLAHADNSIVDAYNTFNDWEGLYKAINAYREELTEMFKPYTTAEKSKNGIRRTNGAENK